MSGVTILPTRRVLSTSLRFTNAPRMRYVIGIKYQDFGREGWPIRYKYMRFKDHVPREVVLERWLEQQQLSSALLPPIRK